MKKILLCVFFFLFSVSAFSQTLWFSQNSGTTTKNLNGIQFINTNTGFIAGDTALFLKTTNGGINWNAIPTGLSTNFRCVYFFDSLTGVIAGGNIEFNTPEFYKTTNGGLNWIQISNIGPGVASPYQLFFTSPTVGYCAGGYSTSLTYAIIRKTINGGNSWSQIWSSGGTGQAVRSIFFPSANTGFACYTNTGEVLRTTNAGVDWTVAYTSGGGSYGVCIYFPSATIGYISTADGKMLKTTNSGNNWNLLPVLGTTDVLYSTYFTSPEIGYAVGTGSTIVKTTNGAASWETNASPSLNTLKSVIFVNSVTGYIVGNGGTILKTTSGGVTFTQPNTTGMPDKFELFQNYPNPFNPSTVINYQLAVSSAVQLKVYDVTGNEIQSLVNERQNAGSYSVDFNAASFPSGIYYYKLLTEKYSETKKMILVK